MKARLTVAMLTSGVARQFVCPPSLNPKSQFDAKNNVCCNRSFQKGLGRCDIFLENGGHLE